MPPPGLSRIERAKWRPRRHRLVGCVRPLRYCDIAPLTQPGHGFLRCAVRSARASMAFESVCLSPLDGVAIHTNLCLSFVAFATGLRMRDLVTRTRTRRIVLERSRPWLVPSMESCCFRRLSIPVRVELEYSLVCKYVSRPSSFAAPLRG